MQAIGCGPCYQGDHKNCERKTLKAVAAGTKANHMKRLIHNLSNAPDNEKAAIACVLSGIICFIWFVVEAPYAATQGVSLTNSFKLSLMSLIMGFVLASICWNRDE